MSFIHIWQISLTPFAPCLSPAEWQRAANIYDPTARLHFTQTRSALRHILARTLNCDPLDIPLIATAQGKPLIDPCHNPNHIQFNVSHSHSQAVCAVAQGYAVGVDIEHERPITHLHKLVERFFHQDEIHHFHTLQEAQQQSWFFHMWSAKEAILKALGQGGSVIAHIPSIMCSASKQLLILEKGWFLQSLPCLPGYTSAIAAQTSLSPALCFHTFEPPK